MVAASELGAGVGVAIEDHLGLCGRRGQCHRRGWFGRDGADSGQVASAVRGARAGWPGRRASPGWSSLGQRRASRAGGGRHAGAHTGRCHALVAFLATATQSGLSKSTVGRIWRAFGLKPHLVDTFKLSSDPLFIEKVRDVVGLYLNPPERAVVLCVDEKSGIQALNRSAPLLPMMPGAPERRTFDYARAGTTDLFAALDVATGLVIHAIQRRHRASEFKKFLTQIDQAVPAEFDVHLICDNLATHKTPAITAWLAAHPRFHLHFTPTSSSWLNQVERWFGLLTDRQIRRGVHDSITALEHDIESWIDHWNANPKPFVWTKTADEILTRLARYLQRIPGAVR